VTNYDPIKAARNDGFNMGTIAALACTFAQGAETLWGEIVRAAGTQDVLRHALTNDGDWEWGGFHRLAVAELGQREVSKARRAVAAWNRRASLVQGTEATAGGGASYPTPEKNPTPAYRPAGVAPSDGGQQQ
jgi:hypothetical protein